MKFALVMVLVVSILYLGSYFQSATQKFDTQELNRHTLN